MVYYYQLLNMKVPNVIWSELVKKHQLDTMSGLIQANIDRVDELRRFIGCFLDLLGKGYIFNEDFRFFFAEIEE